MNNKMFFRNKYYFIFSSSSSFFSFRAFFIASFIIAFSPLTELMMRKITIIINMIAAP